MSAHIKKLERSQKKKSDDVLQILRKTRTSQPKSSPYKEIIKIGAENN
jgi:hypothetical protein